MDLPIKDIEVLMKEWTKDSAIDETEPGRALLNIPKLHSKYLNALTYHTVLSKKVSFDISRRKMILFHYFSGKMDETELEKENLEPWAHRVLRQDIPTYMEADEKLNKLILKKSFNDSIIQYCETVLKELNSRTWQLKSFIDYERMVRGN